MRAAVPLDLVPEEQDRNTASRSDGSTSNIGNVRSVSRTSAATSSVSLCSSEAVAALSRLCPVVRDGDHHHQDQHAGRVSESVTRHHAYDSTGDVVDYAFG